MNINGKKPLNELSGGGGGIMYFTFLLISLCYRHIAIYIIDPEIISFGCRDFLFKSLGQK